MKENYINKIYMHGSVTGQKTLQLVLEMEIVTRRVNSFWDPLNANIHVGISLKTKNKKKP